MPLRLQSIVQRYTLCGRKEWYKSGMSTLPESTASSWWKKENVLRGSSLSRAVRMLSKTRRERFERCGVRALDDETHAHTLHRVARFKQGAHLVLAQRAAVVAHDRHERFHRAAPPGNRRRTRPAGL